MEKARYNTELYSNLSEPLNNVKPSNFLGSHQNSHPFFIYLTKVGNLETDLCDLGLEVLFVAELADCLERRLIT